jgi:hypothetical protein
MNGMKHFQRLAGRTGVTDLTTIMPKQHDLRTRSIKLLVVAQSFARAVKIKYGATKMSKPVRCLHHPASQPYRAVHQFLLETEIPFTEELVDIMSGINEKQGFKDQYNPTGQVPILVDGNFTVWESSAIAFYLNE